MAERKTYYNIRTVEANDETEARWKVEDGIFQEEHKLCDRVLSAEELIKELLLQLENEKENKKG
jgi:hypothetical protein